MMLLKITMTYSKVSNAYIGGNFSLCTGRLNKWFDIKSDVIELVISDKRPKGNEYVEFKLGYYDRDLKIRHPSMRRFEEEITYASVDWFLKKLPRKTYFAWILQ